MANGCREDVDTALLKLYAELDHESLLDLLASENACLLADSVPWLEKYHKCVYKRFHELFLDAIKTICPMNGLKLCRVKGKPHITALWMC